MSHIALINLEDGYQINSFDRFPLNSLSMSKEVIGLLNMAKPTTVSEHANLLKMIKRVNRIYHHRGS